MSTEQKNENPETVSSELTAVGQVVTALRSLSPEARQRVIQSALILLGGTASPSLTGVDSRLAHTSEGTTFLSDEGILPGRNADARPAQTIRTLKEKADPRTAVEMAVLVAYYLRAVAPEAERKNEIGSDDIEKYFRQANFRFRGRARDALRGAKNAGYLDLTDQGKYRLNAVGYNLAVHGLPRKVSLKRASRSKAPGKTTNRHLQEK